MPAKIQITTRRTKYGNQPVWIDGVRFASKKEASRWLVLRGLERAGKISGLERQKRFPLVVRRLKVAEYRADFTYYADGLVVEDVKSPATRKIAAYQIKRKLMKALYGITILET